MTAVLVPMPVEDGALQGKHAESVSAIQEGVQHDAAPAPDVHLHKRTRFLDGAIDVQLKNGPGKLGRVIIGTAPGGMNGVLTLKDGSLNGGRTLAVITPAAAQLLSLNYDAAFTNGLFASLVGATPGSWTITFE